MGCVFFLRPSVVRRGNRFFTGTLFQDRLREAGIKDRGGSSYFGNLRGVPGARIHHKGCIRSPHTSQRVSQESAYITRGVSGVRIHHKGCPRSPHSAITNDPQVNSLNVFSL